MIREFFLQNGLFLVLGTFFLGALGSFVFVKKDFHKIANAWSHGLASLGCLFGVLLGLFGLLSEKSLIINSPWQWFIGVDRLVFKIDAFSSIFIILISLVGLASSLYGISYQKQYLGRYNLGLFGFFYNLLILSFLLVVTVNHGLYFLASWEIMTVASYFLVIFENNNDKNIKAGYLYLLMSQFGALILAISLVILSSKVGSWDFDVIRKNSSNISLMYKNIILGLSLFGLSVKAGIIPLHIWLPEAHPAAPSHVSALMSGVMIKLAIFMMARFFFDFFSGVGWYWGALILFLGIISTVMGVLYALAEHNIKRLLAFHSVENIGIILLGFGSALVLVSYNLWGIAIIAFVGMFYHVINHAVFKSLLFLTAGSVVKNTGTYDIENYGGLLKKMPYTGGLFLIGSIAISALPPLNGFVSEWIVFQSIFAGISLGNHFIKMLFIFGAISLALGGGLAAMCFVKVFGATFLAKPRSVYAENAFEENFIVKFSVSILAFLIFVLSLGANFIAQILTKVGVSVFGHENFHLDLDSLTSNYLPINMPAIFFILIIVVLMVFILMSFMSRSRTVSCNKTWSCGSELNSRMEITSGGFSRSIIVMFKKFPLMDIYNPYVYKPASKMVERFSFFVRKIQGGNVNVYIVYIFITLFVLFFWSLR